LNREQTDEWKGWMQLVILIYHVSGASVFIPVYMHVRVLVAAYLFQTGYGHFSFFWLKGDFSLYRVCQVLFRLNFLVLVLCVVMDRPYQFYYFVPLVTFWFFIIYGTLAMWPQILQKKANSSGMWYMGVLVKLLGLLLFICFFAFSQVGEGFFESIFSAWPFSKLFELNGSVREWWFRWKLDRFVSTAPPPRPPGAPATLTALCCFAGGDTWYAICLPLPGASEAPGAVGEQRRGPLLCQDFQPAPLPLRRLFY
ncbi:unnamed protein product, partial [Tetraodon nigroviridis]